MKVKVLDKEDNNPPQPLLTPDLVPCIINNGYGLRIVTHYDDINELYHYIDTDPNDSGRHSTFGVNSGAHNQATLADIGTTISFTQD